MNFLRNDKLFFTYVMHFHTFLFQNSDGKGSDVPTDNIYDVEFELECNDIQDEESPKKDLGSQHCQLYYVLYYT